eukprot:5133926-Amphidinium_carterae.1
MPKLFEHCVNHSLWLLLYTALPDDLQCNSSAFTNQREFSRKFWRMIYTLCLMIYNICAAIYTCSNIDTLWLLICALWLLIYRASGYRSALSSAW